MTVGINLTNLKHTMNGSDPSLALIGFLKVAARGYTTAVEFEYVAALKADTTKERISSTRRIV